MKTRTVVRTFLLGLPIGLIVMGVLSMLYHFSYGKGKNNNGEQIEPREITRQNLEKLVRRLAVDVGERNMGSYPNLLKAASFIESTLGPSNLGYKVREQTYKVSDKSVSNFIVEIAGLGKQEEIVIVGAHYDTVPGTGGANDNTSGTAALLALAQAFIGTKNERTLRFVAFVNEEPPYFQTELMGSRVYARSCREKNEKIVGMLSLETMAYFSDERGSQKYPAGLALIYPKTANFIALVGNFNSRSLVAECKKLWKAHSDFPVESAAFPEFFGEMGWSDHWSFWQEDYPALMVTDTAPFRYPHYHKPTDTPDKLDFPKFLRVTQAVREVVNRLVNPSRAGAKQK